MADADFKESLDFIDILSVCLYRLGITLFSLSLLFYALLLFAKSGWFLYLPDWEHYVVISLCISSAMCGANIHVYRKSIRTIIAWASWIGIILIASQPYGHVQALGIGFLFVTYSGIALKESFCFRVIGLKYIPLLLAPAALLVMFDYLVLAGTLLIFASVILGYLAVKKWQMPLHFDIGNKAKYQI